MNSERWQKIESIFTAALECPADQHNVLLDEACAGDAELRGEIVSLLAAHHQSDGFLTQPLLEKNRPAEPDTASLVGQQIGRYQILSPLGRGAMGEVYLAEDARLGRKLALKLLPREFTSDRARVERFRHEARAASALNHPNIITIFEIDQSGDRHFIATEFIDGQTLRQRLSSGQMDWREAVAIAAQIAAALAAAHEAGIIHRDIKPENVMLRRDGLVKLLDFGLAKTFDHESANIEPMAPAAISMETDPTILMGTINYLSPEQALRKQVDHRTDIFSLGVVLYEMVSGHRPFAGNNAAEILEAILNASPAPIGEDRQPPAKLLSVISRALIKNREARFQTADQLRSELQRFLREPVTAKLLSLSRRPARWNSWAAKFTVAVAIAVTCALIGSRWWPGKANKTLSPPWNRAYATAVTALSGDEFFPSLAPDGRSVVYARRLNGQWDVCRQRFADGTILNLTGDFEGDDTEPAFSPDGSLIAFRSDRDGGGIFLLSAESSASSKPVKQLTTGGYNPAWSPDGKEIVYATENANSPSVRSAANSEIHIVTIATGKTRRIETGDALQPHWSPNGKRIAYWGVERGGQRDIWTVAVDGGSPAPVTHDADIDWNPVWHPGGQFLYFGSNRKGAMSFWLVPIDQQTGKVLGEPEAVIGSTAECWHPGFSRDGRRLVYVQRLVRENLHSIQFDLTKGMVDGSPLPVTEEARRATAPSISPDGKWLAYYSFGGTQENLFVINVETKELRQLTNDKCRDRVPRWSPDGTQLAFYSDLGGSYEIWTINVVTGKRRQVTFLSGKGAAYPLWSPDGLHLAYYQRGVNTFLIETARPWKEQAPVPLAPMAESNHWFTVWSWSPDGKKLAGVRTQADGDLPGITVYSLDSRQYEQITEIGGEPVWLNDNRRLLFIHQRKLYLADSQTKTFRQLLSRDPLQITLAVPSPDNRRIYFSQITSESDIRLLTLE